MTNAELEAGRVTTSGWSTNAWATVTGNTVSQFGLGYVYSLSKRTAVYSTVSRLTNGNGLPAAAIANSVGGGAPTAGGNSTGFEFGVRHFF